MAWHGSRSHKYYLKCKADPDCWKRLQERKAAWQRGSGRKKRQAPRVSAAEVAQHLSIDNDGVIRWRHDIPMNGIKAGDEWGSVHDSAASRPTWSPQWRRVGVLNGKSYMGHNVAWALYYGEWPPKGWFVDHIDNNALNNRKINLRLATKSQNAQNAKRPKLNKSGTKGIYWCTHTKGWYGAITVDRRKYRKYFGRRRYGSLENAKQAATEWVCAMRHELHGDYGNHGEQSVILDREVGTWLAS